MRRVLSTLALALLAPVALAQNVPCPEKNVQYWQAFPPGGESDLSARHQQLVLHRKCPSVDAIIQYKAGAGGALMWTQMNQLPGDGLNVVGVNLPHIVFQPIQGDVQYKTQDVTPVFWFHFTPGHPGGEREDHIRNFQEFVQAAKAKPGHASAWRARASTRPTTRATNASTRPSASRRCTCRSRARATSRPPSWAGQVDGAMTVQCRSRSPTRTRACGPIAVADGQAPSADARTCPPSRSWASTGWTAPTAASACRSRRRRKRASASPTCGAPLNNDAEMKEKAAKSGFELVNVGVEEMDGFMAGKTKLYTEGATRMGLGKK
jgi:hypothetical protein